MAEGRLQIKLFGQTRLMVRGSSVDRLPSRRIEALLAYLALHPGWQSRERVAEAVWPEQPDGKASASLRNALSVLRRILEPTGIEDRSLLESTRTQVRLSRDGCQCDVWQFQDAVARKDSASALALYAADLLPDIDDEWLEPIRVSLRGQFHWAARDEADRLLADGRPAEALRIAERWRESDPWEPAAVGARLLALAVSGRRTEALAELGRLQADEDELLQLDFALLRRRIEQAREARAEAPSAPEIPARALRSLPTYVSRFFGRSEELEHVLRWMSGPSRLLSIIGAGGVGKTRLAVEAGRKAPDSSEVLFVPLAGSDSEAAFLAALLDVFGLREVESETVEQTLTAFLGRKEKPLVLILDNLEQIVGPAGKVLMMLLQSPESVRFLVTSREVLGLEGEQLLTLAPFEASDAAPSAQPGLAIEMFVDRARNARADFALTHRNRRDVADLCNELEGLPLAIEIAAGWSAVLSVGEMRERVHDRRMVARKRGHDARHHSLGACIEWSFSLLSPETRDLACMLSLFRGGWTLAACEAVTQTPDAATLLAGLVDRSLVNLEETELGIRFSMLESVRTFFRSRLPDELARQAAVRMADYFRQMAQSHTNPCAGEEERVNHRKLDKESENIEAIVALCEDGLLDADEALAVAGPMQLHWTYRGQANLGLTLVERLLARSSPLRAGHGTMIGLQALTVLQRDAARYDLAEETVGKMIALAERQGDRESLFRTITQLGNLQSQLGRYADSLPNHRQALEYALLLGIPRMEAVAHCNLAESLFGLGEIQEAKEHYARSAELDRQNGNIAGEATLCLGFVQALEGDVSCAAGNLDRYLSNVQGLGYRRGVWRAVHYTALAAAKSGEADLARTLRAAAQEAHALDRYVFDETERRWLAMLDDALEKAGGEEPVARIDPDEAVELACRFLSQSREARR